MKIRYMKTATWIFLLLFLVGCNMQSSAPCLEHIMHCEIQITKSKEHYQAVLERSLAGFCRFKLLSPESVKDMTVTMENGINTYTFQGLSHSLEPAEDSSLFFQTAEILEQIIRGESLVWETTKEQFTGQGTVNGRSFRVVCDKKTNRIVSIVTQDGLEVDFDYTGEKS